MKYSTLGAVTMVILALAACADQATSPNTLTPDFARGNGHGGGGGGSQTNPGATWDVPATGAFVFLGDGTAYVGGSPCVDAAIQVASGSGDATIQTSTSSHGRTHCNREFTFTGPNGAWTATGNGFISNITGVTSETGPQTRHFFVAPSSGECSRIDFGIGGQQVGGGDEVIVTALSETKWQITSRENGDALCTFRDGTGSQSYPAAVDFTVTQN